MIAFSHFREEKGKKEIKALQKQLQDVKKQTDKDLQVRALSTGHLARGKPVRKLASAAQGLALGEAMAIHNEPPLRSAEVE